MSVGLPFANTGLVAIAVTGRTLTPSGPLVINDGRQRLPGASAAVTLTGSVNDALFDVYAVQASGNTYILAVYPTGTDTSMRSDLVLIGQVRDYPTYSTALWLPGPGASLFPYIQIDPDGGIMLVPFAAKGTSHITFGRTDRGDQAQFSFASPNTTLATLIAGLTLLGKTRVAMQTNVAYTAMVILDGTTVTVQHSGLTIAVAGATTTPGDSQQMIFDAAGHIAYKQVSGLLISAGSGAGTSGTPSAFINGTDQHGLIAVTTVTAPSANATVATVTFRTPYGTRPFAVELVPANRNALLLAASAQCLANAQLATPCPTFTVDAGTTALAAATTYQWTYHVMSAA